MQFIELHLKMKVLLAVIRTIPEQWWKHGLNDLTALLGFLPDANHEILARYATEVSISIGQHWLRKQGESEKFTPMLVNCTVSQERLITINIPLKSDQFYQLRISPLPEKRFSVRFFYPEEGGPIKWYGRLAAHLTYDMDIGSDLVCMDSETITIKAWNAMCAMLVAQGFEDKGEVAIMMDMAREGII